MEGRKAKFILCYSSSYRMWGSGSILSTDTSNKKEEQPLEDCTKVDSICKNVLMYAHNQMKNSRNEEQRTPKRDYR